MVSVPAGLLAGSIPARLPIRLFGQWLCARAQLLTVAGLRRLFTVFPIKLDERRNFCIFNLPGAKLSVKKKSPAPHTDWWGAGRYPLFLKPLLKNQRKPEHSVKEAFGWPMPFTSTNVPIIEPFAAYANPLFHK